MRKDRTSLSIGYGSTTTPIISTVLAAFFSVSAYCTAEYRRPLQLFTSGGIALVLSS
jgi:hypothetical protein